MFGLILKSGPSSSSLISFHLSAPDEFVDALDRVHGVASQVELGREADQIICKNFKRGQSCLLQKVVSDEGPHVLVLDDHHERNRDKQDEDGGEVLGQVEALAVGWNDEVKNQVEAEHHDHQDGRKS